MNIEIVKSSLLIVEGYDDERFFKSFARYLGMEEKVQIIPIRGQIGYRELKSVVFTSGFRRVKSLGIIRDANDNPQGAFQSIVNSLKRLGFSPPSKSGEFVSKDDIKVGILVLPENKKGELETVIAKVLNTQHSERMSCVDLYFKCLQGNGINIKKIDKAKVYAYFTSYPDPDKRLGEAAEAGYWSWDDKEFGSIREFILKLTN